ncbi:MAG: helix-turn-helix domain-containing protein [bacterium]|nr:helix-turn-helix domain-containing protein [bacterium]
MTETFFGNKTFCEQLCLYRKRQKISQDNLGAKAGLSRGYVNKFENGMQIPKVELVRKLSAALELNPDEEAYLIKAAAKSFLLNSDYNEHFGFLKNYDPDTLEQMNFIPLFDYPLTKIMPPYKDIKPVRYYPIHHDMVEKECYAVIYEDEYSTREIEYKKGDILIIDPVFSHLNLGDYVLVRIYDQVTIKGYQMVQDENRVYIHFIPYAVAGEATIFDPIADSNKFEILGKVVCSIKLY